MLACMHVQVCVCVCASLFVRMYMYTCLCIWVRACACVYVGVGMHVTHAGPVLHQALSLESVDMHHIQSSTHQTGSGKKEQNEDER